MSDDSRGARPRTVDTHTDEVELSEENTDRARFGQMRRNSLDRVAPDVMGSDEDNGGGRISLLDQLSSANVYDALEVDAGTRGNELETALSELRDQLSVLSPSEPDYGALHKRVDQLARLVNQPMERALHARAALLRQDIADPEVRAHLETEWLEREVWRLLNDERIAEAAPLAERYFKLAPNEVLAKSAVAWVRGVVGPPSGREAAATMAASTVHESPKSIEARLALGYVSHAAGRADRASTALRALLEMAPRDHRVARLEKTVGPLTVAKRPFLSFDLAAMPKSTRVALIVTGCLLVIRLAMLAFGV